VKSVKKARKIRLTSLPARLNPHREKKALFDNSAVIQPIDIFFYPE
jgi:hypothetical protein